MTGVQTCALPILQDNEHRIEERLTELGWDVIETLLSMENDDE